MQFLLWFSIAYCLLDCDKSLRSLFLLYLGLHPILESQEYNMIRTTAAFEAWQWADVRRD